VGTGPEAREYFIVRPLTFTFRPSVEGRIYLGWQYQYYVERLWALSARLRNTDASD
jgi:hypothetical protein